MLLLYIFNLFVFSTSFELEIVEEKIYDKVDYFIFQNDSIFAIQDEFYENKIVIKTIYNNITNVNVLDDAQLKFINKEDKFIVAQKNNSLYLYDILNDKYKYLLELKEEYAIDNFKYIQFDTTSHLLINNNYYKDGELIHNNAINIIYLNESLFIMIQNQNNLTLLKNNEIINRYEYFYSVNLLNYKESLLLINSYQDRLLLKEINTSGEITSNYWLNTTYEYLSISEKLIYYDLIELKFKSLFDENEELFSYINKFDNYILNDDKLIIKNANTLEFIEFDGNIQLKYENDFRIDDFKINQSKIYLLSDGKLKILTYDKNDYWMFEMLFIDNIFYIFIGILIIIILRLFFKYQQKQIIFRTIFDLPSTGLIIHLNDKGELINLNQFSRHIFSIPDSVKLGEYFKKYISNNETNEFNELINKALHLRQSFKQKINLKVDNNMLELMCNVISIQNFAGLFRGLLITGTDITEELENKRMSNWAQLAHDMQTNLSTIKLNIEQMESTNEKDISRKSKIISQTNLLIKRIRDIVTVGRSNSLNKVNYSSDEVFNELMNEFDLNYYPNIQIEKKVEKFNFVADKDKIIRALRNAFENAIKIFDHKNGIIEIIFRRDNRFVYLSIKDNGKGMDKETLLKMKDPYFTTKDSKGGSGIGTIIMQKVMEQHGGEFIIQSQKNIGTEVIFKIPYYRSK